MSHQFNKELYNHPLSGKIIGCAIEVHRNLGPGLLEDIYRKALSKELEKASLPFVEECRIPVTYKGEVLDGSYRIDLFIDSFVVVELKAVEKLTPVHQAQLLTYMKLVEAPIGLLINFNVKLLKNGVKKLAISKFSEATRLLVRE